jgi:uncharacterized OB-fold protein
MKRPFLPTTPASDPYWSFLQQGELRVQKCTTCEQLVFYPRDICPHCSGLEFTWERLSGQGMVYSFTVIRRPLLPEFAAIAPYVYAIIEMEEGIRLASTIIDCPVEDVFVGMPVVAVYNEEDSDRKVLLFKPLIADD